MIYCGSGSNSYFGKVLVPFPVMVPVPLRQKVAVPVPALFHNTA
jgi:hypothetical protein